MAALTRIEKVEDNDDLLRAILIQLPPKSIFKFRCASNRWNDIINHSFFLQSYTNKRKKELHINGRDDRLVAFIQTTPDVFDYDPPRITILPTTTPTTMYMMKDMDPSSTFGKIINCSNGLILFAHQRESSTTINLHILNPLIGKPIVLPPPTLSTKAILGFACEDNKRELKLNYRVVAAAVIPYEEMDNTLPIQTYSSKTRVWEKSTLIGTGNFALLDDVPSLVFNGVFHWHAAGVHLAVYDSNIIINGGCHDNNHVQLIELPDEPNSISTITSRSSSTGDDDDGGGVLWAATNCLDVVMKFWMLPKGGNDDIGYRRSTTIPKTEWILMHTIPHESVRIDTTTILLSLENERNIKRAESFEWRRLIPWNPFVAVMRVGENKVFLYNVVTKSFELVRFYGRSRDHSYWTLYMESLSLSSYAL